MGRRLHAAQLEQLHHRPCHGAELRRVESQPVDWFESGAGKKDDKNSAEYQSYVSIHRKEDFVLPIVIEIRFDNGEKIREHWDGQSRWTRFAYRKKAKVASVEIDPDHTVQIDRNNFNNSYDVDGSAKATYKLSNYWQFVSQWLGQTLAWWGV